MWMEAKRACDRNGGWAMTGSGGSEVKEIARRTLDCILVSEPLDGDGRFRDGVSQREELLDLVRRGRRGRRCTCHCRSECGLSE